jgi:hypothetical protein
VKVFHDATGASENKSINHKHFLESAVDSFVPESEYTTNIESLSITEKVAFTILHGSFLAEPRSEYKHLDEVLLLFWAIFRCEKTFFNNYQKGKVKKIRVEDLRDLGLIFVNEN